MNRIRIDPHWNYRGLPALVATTPMWRATVLPSVGGRVWELEYRPRGIQFLWQNPRVPPRPVPFGATYDDVWVGGWDDIFPTDAPFNHRGDHFPDHGELWNSEWEFECSEQEDAALLHLWTFGHVTPTRIDKWLRVSAFEPRIDIRYRIHHEGEDSFPFLFKLHPALSVDEHCRIVLPACRFIPDAEFSTWFGGDPAAFNWPHATTRDGSPVDLRQVCPPASKAVLFGYAVDLSAGWCGIVRARDNLGLGLVFPRDVLKSCWIFSSYGGFRNHQVVVLEPSTGHPWRLEEEIANDTARTLEGRASFEVAATVMCVETGSESELAGALQRVNVRRDWPTV